MEATRLRLGSGEGQTGAPGRELPLPLEVLVTDGEDHPVPDVQVRFSVQEGGGTLSAEAIPTDHQGRAQVRWTLGAEPGPQSVRATADDPAGFPLNGSPLTLSAQAITPPAARLVLRQPPSEVAQNGIVFPRQPVVDVLDAEDQPVAGASVTVAIASGPGTLNGTTTISSNAAGRVVYTDLAILGDAGTHALVFGVADPPIQGPTATVEVQAGPSARIEGNPPLVYEGIVNSPVLSPDSRAPSVLVTDDTGNPVAGVVVTFSADRDGSVSPTTVATDQGGIAQVTSWTLGRTADVGYRLFARLSSGNPVVFTANSRAGAAGRLEIAVQPPSTVRSGTPFDRQPGIQMVDQSGNPVRQAGVSVSATVFSGPSGSLQSASAITNTSGRATFSGLTLTGQVGEYALAFSAPELAGVTSSRITLSAGPAARLTLVRQPSLNGRSRIPLATQPVVQLEDDRGNPVALSGVQVTASIAAGGGSLTGQTTTVTDGTGLASYSDLAVVGSPGSRTLRFASTNPAAEVVSGLVSLPAVAAISAVTSPPETALVGTPLQNPASWSLTDADGRPVADASAQLTASTGNAVHPTTDTSDAGGIVRLETWTVSQQAGIQGVQIAVGEVKNSVTLVAIPGSAARLLKVSGDSQSAPVNSELPEPLVVRVVDQFANGVSGVPVEWRTCDGIGELNALTDLQGFSSAFQPTGSESGTFCVSASSAGLEGSPVEFTFSVASAEVQ